MMMPSSVGKRESLPSAACCGARRLLLRREVLPAAEGALLRGTILPAAEGALLPRRFAAQTAALLGGRENAAGGFLLGGENAAGALRLRGENTAGRFLLGGREYLAGEIFRQAGAGREVVRPAARAPSPPAA